MDGFKSFQKKTAVPFYDGMTAIVGSNGSGKSNVYYTEMSEMMVGRGTNWELDSSTDRRFLEDETLIKLVSHWDFVMKHNEAASVIEDYQLQTS